MLSIVTSSSIGAWGSSTRSRLTCYAVLLLLPKADLTSSSKRIQFWNGRKVLRPPVNAMIACLLFVAWPVHSMRKTSDIRCLRSMSSATRQRGVGPAIFLLRTIDRLLQTAAQLTSRRSIQPVTFKATLSLIASTGLRVSEALKLQLSDITENGLLIRATKFQKSRLVPLHATASSGLQQYLNIRERMTTTANTVFVSKRGTAIPYPTMNQTFLHLARTAGMRPGPGLGGCRIHDLRHTFAVRSLEQC